MFAVQFRGEAAGSEGELDEASAGGDDDQDGGARQGIHEGQTEGGLLGLHMISATWTLIQKGKGKYCCVMVVALACQTVFAITSALLPK